MATPTSHPADSAAALTPRASLSAITHQDDIRSAKAGGDANHLWRSAESFISNISLRYSRSDHTIEEFEWDMHDLWHLYYCASMNISEDRPEQDRLILQILSARELGVLNRKNEKMEVIEEARTSNGRIWADLPFLVGDFTNYWIRESTTMSASERVNFALFLAKLGAVGIGGDHVCGCALIVLRDALETSRPVLYSKAPKPSNGQGGQQEGDEADILSVAELLPAANMWILKAGNKIIELSQRSFNMYPAHVGMVGDLTRAGAGVPESGFSPQRWLFWVKRLTEIEIEAPGEINGLVTLARDVKNNMIAIAGESDTDIRRELGRQGQFPEFEVM